MNDVAVVIDEGIKLAPTERKFQDKALERHTKAIEKLMVGVKKNMVEIAVRLKDIKENALFEKDGYKDVFEYADKVLGYKKNTVYKMVTVADKFIVKTEDGKSYISVIAHKDADYTVSQLIELGTLSREEAIELNTKLKIDPTMSAKDIREVVKEYKEQNKPTEEADEEADEESDVVDGEATDITEEVDRTAMLLLDVSDSLDSILTDDRLTKEQKVNIENIRNYLLGITF